MPSMVVETEYEDLPGKVVEKGKRTALDTLAVIMGGSAMEGCRDCFGYQTI